MIPENEPSSSAVVTGFSFPVKSTAPEDKLQDWEMAGLALNDPSAGLLYQLWHFTLEVDQDTLESKVFAEAPSVPKTLLFEGLDITEIAGCFDQNMNPFVAYMEGNIPRIYWYDSIAAAQVHTDLDPGAIDLRCSLDEKRPFGIGDSDIILSYVRDGALYYLYQRDRYTIEYMLSDNVTHLISMAVNVGFRMQWRANGENAGGYTDPFLGDIVYDLGRRSNIPPQNLDVRELYRETDRVPGLMVAVDEGLDQPIDWLRPMYQFDKSQHGRKLHFPHRGRDPVAWIPYNHLVITGNKEALAQERIDEQKLPRIVNINHIDSLGGFAKNKQSVSRRSNLITTTKEETINSQVVLTPDGAANAALVIIKTRHNEQFDYKFTTTIRYSEITTGDVVMVEDAKKNWHRIRIELKGEDSGNIDWEGKQDAGPLAYEMINAAGNPLKPPVPTTPGLVGDTILDILNLPVQRDQDDELGLYLAAYGTGSGWSGYALYLSVDLGVTYTQMFTAEQASNVGETATYISDLGTAVEVLMPYPLASVSPAQIAAGYNRAVIGDEEIQFQTATLLGMVDGLYHYNLTDITRHVLHTTAEVWAAGTRFVFLDDSIIFARIQREFYGMDLYYKAVSYGQSLDDVDPLAYLFDHALSQTEWPVTDVEVVAAEGGGVTVTWVGSPRLGTFGANPFHSKYLVGYQVKFSDGHIIETTEQTVTYPAGLLGTVVEVRARNAITGLGPLADGTGSVDPGDIPTFLFSGNFSDGFEGEPLEQWNGEGFTASGGLWDANARGFVVPGVGVCCIDRVNLAGTRIVGIPHEAGTFTTKAQVDATSPDPSESGTVNISQSVTIYPRRSYGALDLTFKQHAYSAKLMVTTPPLKQFQVESACSFFFYGVTSGKVWGQFRITGSSAPFLIGINNSKGVLTLSDYTVAIGPFDPATYRFAIDATYSVELDADTGDFWIYEDVGSGPVEVHSGNLPLPPGNEYRICITTEYIQSFVLEANGGNETPYTTVTQVGHTGVPVPVRPIPLAWGYVQPDYAMSFNGNGERGAYFSDNTATAHVSKSNAAYSSGKHRWQMHGGQRNGICVAAFDETHGPLGSPGSPNSLGVQTSAITAGSVTIWRCFGGVPASSDVALPAPYSYPQIIFALDADGDTLKICAMDATGTSVVVLDTIPLPSGQTWYAAETGADNNAQIKYDPPGPTGYANAVVP